MKRGLLFFPVLVVVWSVCAGCGGSPQQESTRASASMSEARPGPDENGIYPPGYVDDSHPLEVKTDVLTVNGVTIEYGHEEYRRMERTPQEYPDDYEPFIWFISRESKKVHLPMPEDAPESGASFVKGTTIDALASNGDTLVAALAAAGGSGYDPEDVAVYRWELNAGELAQPKKLGRYEGTILAVRLVEHKIVLKFKGGKEVKLPR